MEKVGIIGAGKIGGSLLVRLAESEGFDLAVSDIHPEQLEPYRGYGVRTTSSNRELAERSDLVAAVKPWDVAQVLSEVAPAFEGTDKALVSVAAGVSIASISEKLPSGTAVLRVMPNVAASVGLGSAVVTANEPGLSTLPTVMDIFRHVGDVMELPERLFDAATALHGSGPAYVALFADALIQAGVREGIPRDVARRLVVETIGRDGGTAQGPERPPGARRGYDARRDDGCGLRRDGKGRVRRSGLRRGQRGDGAGAWARRITVALLLQTFAYSIANLLSAVVNYTYYILFGFIIASILFSWFPSYPSSGFFQAIYDAVRAVTNPILWPMKQDPDVEARGFRDRPLPDHCHLRAVNSPQLAADNHRPVHSTCNGVISMPIRPIDVRRKEFRTASAATTPTR